MSKEKGHAEGLPQGTEGALVDATEGNGDMHHPHYIAHLQLHRQADFLILLLAKRRACVHVGLSVGDLVHLPLCLSDLVVEALLLLLQALDPLLHIGGVPGETARG